MTNINYLFELYINTSIKGSVLIILILVLQKIFRKDFTAKWTYSLWSLVLIRLAFPILPIKNVISLYNLGLIKRLRFNVNDVLLGRLVSCSNKFEILGKTISTQSFIDKSLSFDWFNLLSTIWILGIIILSLTYIYMLMKIKMIINTSYKSTHENLLNIISDFQKQISLKKNISLYVSSDLSSPMTCGVFSPKIILPKDTLSNLSFKNLEHIFMHELIHIKKYDVFFSNLGIIICIIHWFNPLVWIGFLKSKKDCELACDEEVLKYLTDDEYIQYGLTLIEIMKFASQQNTLNPIICKTLIYDRTEANSRILHISKFQKKRKSVIVLSIIILFITFLIGLNESSNIRPSNIYNKYNLYEYLQVTEHDVRQAFGHKPKHRYFINANNCPYIILHYNILGEKVEFWFDGTIGNNSRKTLEITTTSYKGIKQGMSTNKANKIASTKFIKLKKVEKTDSLVKYTYEDANCNLLVISDKKTNKIYSLTLY